MRDCGISNVEQPTAVVRSFIPTRESSAQVFPILTFPKEAAASLFLQDAHQTSCNSATSPAYESGTCNSSFVLVVEGSYSERGNEYVYVIDRVTPYIRLQSQRILCSIQERRIRKKGEWGRQKLEARMIFGRHYLMFFDTQQDAGRAIPPKYRRSSSDAMVISTERSIFDQEYRRRARPDILLKEMPSQGGVKTSLSTCK